MTSLRTTTLPALAALLFSGPAATALEVPYLSGRVNDLADLLPADAEARIEARLERIESQHGSQVAVLTIPSLDGEVLEDYGLRVAETWKLGRGEFDDGALLLIAHHDRKMRLEVGYGLEPTLTDVVAKRILDDVMRPRFRQGDFAGGIEAAVDIIAGLIAGEDSLPPPAARSRSRPAGGLAGRLAASAVFLLVMGNFLLAALFNRGCMGWFLYLFLTPFWFFLPMAFLGPRAGLVPGFLWLFGFPLLWLLVNRTAGGRSFQDRHGGFLRRGGSWSTSGGGWSGGGSSGGGFSGGGGSFGGGGSSGSW